MKTLRPGQKFDISLQRDGEQFIILIRLGGAVYRLWVPRSDVESLCVYLQSELNGKG